MLSVEFENILEKYKKHKLDTLKVIELLKSDIVGGDEFSEFGYTGLDTKKFASLNDCGTQLDFVRVARKGERLYRLKAANFCRQRVCPMCQFRKSEKQFAQTLEVVQELEQNGYRFLHLVLTIPNCDTPTELLQSVQILYKGFSTFYMYNEIRSAFKGVLRCLEVSYNYDNDTYHPHLHCLVCVRQSYFNDAKRYIKYDKMRLLWTNAIKKVLTTCDYAPVSLRCFADSDALLQIHIGALKDGDISGIAEVSKYCVKPLELDDEARDSQNIRLLLTLWCTLKGTRFVQKYGVFKDKWRELYGSDCDDGSDGSDNDDETVEAELWLNWDSKRLHYRSEKT